MVNDKITLTVVTTFLGTLIALWQLRNNQWTRKNALFDRRYAFYQKVRNCWLETANEDSPDLRVEDWIPLAEEGEFVFGKDISAHILSFADRRHKGHLLFPNDDFIRPFKKYLALK